MKIYIVEDEPLITATAEQALQKHGFTPIGDADCFEDALKEISKLTPDLVLLDIQLEGEKDGVDLAKELDKRGIPYIYLTSQTDPSTIARVKETQPLGYIVKPFTEAGLRSNIELAWHNFSLTNKDFILLKSEGRTHKINQANITYLKAFDNYCYVHTLTDRLLVAKTLKHIELLLNPKKFIRIHRSFVVNIHRISSINSTSILVQEEELPLSKSNREQVKKRLQEL